MGTMKGNVLPHVRVSENRRFLITEDGKPFFWLGDTAWELFHKLNREEADRYLNNRAAKRFNVIQAVALAELDGLRSPNAYGRLPLLSDAEGQPDPTQPDVSVESAGERDYWDHVDYIVGKAESLGLYIGLLPTWGDKYNLRWGKGPVVFNEHNARIYGEWLGRRYADQSNIIWIMGGDRDLEEPAHYAVVRAMAEGIKLGDGGKHVMTFHPPGGSSSSRLVHNDDWLDFNMIQSGHSELDSGNYAKVTHDYSLEPIKPVLDGEPRYEDHPIGFKPENGFFREYDVRQAAYWAVFAGGFGHTYGHHSIWCMNTEPGEYFTMYWHEAIDRPGGGQMRHVRALIESRPFLERVPDQSLVIDELSGADRLQATRGKDYAFIYSATGKPIEVRLGILTGEQLSAYWYDPRTGAATRIGEYANQGTFRFDPPSQGRGHDWVLVLDDTAKGYDAPGV